MNTTRGETIQKCRGIEEKHVGRLLWWPTDIGKQRNRRHFCKIKKNNNNKKIFFKRKKRSPPLQALWVRSLLRELRSPVLHGAAISKKKKKGSELYRTGLDL